MSPKKDIGWIQAGVEFSCQLFESSVCESIHQSMKSDGLYLAINAKVNENIPYFLKFFHYFYSQKHMQRSVSSN